MAAQETFEWYVATMGKHSDPEMALFIKKERATLYTLRSEDERQRFVEEVLQQLRAMQRQNAKH